MKSKHLLLMLLLALLAPWAANGQDLADYTFTTGQDQNQWITLSDGATSIVSVDDDAVSTLTDIGFSFPFGDGVYTQFWANSNGIFSFNSSPANNWGVQFQSSYYNKYQPKICGITKDMCVPSSGYVKYELTGTAPNRVLVCEFNLGSTSSASSATVNFQVQLHESGSKVVLVYGASASVSSFQIGLSQSSSDIWTVNPSTHEATHATGAVSTTYSVWPGENRYYAFERPVISCPKPTNLAATIVPGDGTRTTFSWTENGEATSWQLCINDDEDNLIDMDQNPFTYNGLTPEVATTAKVRAYCSSTDQSQWSNTVTFTPTDAYILSLNEGSGTNYYVPIYYSYISYSSLNTASQFIIPASDLNSIQWADIEKLTFYANTATANFGNAEFTVYAGETAATTQTSFTDWNMLTEVYTGSVSVNNNMMEITFDNPFSYTTGNLLIGIKITTAGTNPSSFTWKGVSGLTSGVSLYSGYSSTPSTQSFLPQVTIEYTPGVPPSCLPPTNLAVTANGYEATFTWASDVDNYEVVYSTSATADPATLTPASVTAEEFVETMTEFGDYYFWVRANCGANGYSSWAGPVSVHIGYCVPTLSSSTTTYYISNFTTTDGLTNINNTTTGAGHSYSDFFDSYSASAYEGLTINFTITIAGGSTHGSAIWVDWNNDMAFSADERVYHTTNYASSPHSGSFTVPTGATLGDLRMRVVSDYSGSNPSNPCSASTGEFEDYKLTIVAMPTCWQPQNLQYSGVTNNSATLTWTRHANGDETAWVLQYSEDDNTFAAANTTEVNVSDNPTYTIDGNLHATTRYYVRVKPACDNAGELWSDVIDFETEADCMVPNTLAISGITAHGASLDWNGNNDSYTLQYCKAITDPVDINETYDFEDGTQGWTTIDADGHGDAWSRYNGSSYAHGGNYSMKATYNYSYDHQDYLVSPQITLGGTFSFYAKKGGSYNDYFRVYLSTSGNEASDFTIELTDDDVNPSNTYGQYTYDLSSYSGTGYVAIVYTAPANQLNLYIDDIHITANIPGVYDECQTVTNATKPYPFTELAAETYYQVQVNGHCNSTNTTTAWSEPIVFKTEIACPAPTNLEYSNVTPHTAKLTWNVNGNTTTHYVLTQNGAESNIAVTIDEGVATYTLTNLEGETEYTVKVKADCTGNNDDYSSESDEVTFTTDVACFTPTNFTASNETTSSMELSWTNGSEGQDAWVIAYKKDGDADFTEKNVTTNPYTLNELEDGKTYTLKIRANCGETDGLSQWSSEITHATTASCATPENVAVTANSETAYGAEITWTGAATNHKIEYREVITSPAEVDETYDFEDGTLQGWTTISNDNDNNAWTNQSSSAHQGNRCVRARYVGSSDGGDANDWLISPQVPLGGTLGFYARRYGANYTDQFQVYVSTTGSEIADFTAISEVITPNAIYDYYEYDLSAYSGNGYVAIVYTAPNDQYYLYVDDITITASIAGEYGEWQTVSNVTSPHTFNTLDPETSYEVRVIGDCGATTSPYSDVVSFTTLVACIPPTNLEYDNVTAHTADLTWNVNGNTTTHYVLIKNGVESDIAVTINEGVASYTIENLNGETEYTVSVKANCDEEGYSSESNERTFTTLVACPAPTNMEVTVSGADVTVTWEGDATSYNIDVNGTVTEDVASPYIINGELATSYTIKVQAVCAGEGESTWTNEETVTTALCLPANQCELTFELTDAWGDGWNGNYISVVDVLTNTELAQLTNENLNGTSGSGENELNTLNLSVCDGREIQFQYHIGVGNTYPSENSWVIKDVNDEIIWEGQGSDGESDQNYTVSCAANPCKTPKNLTVDNIESQSAELSWEGEMTTYNMQYRHALEGDPTAPATIILEAHDVWGDGSGYMMLLDADASAYGTLWNTQHQILVNGVLYEGGDLAEEYFDEFEYKAPTDADGSLSTTHVVVDGTVTITIPAGTYDYAFFNPTPGDQFYIAADNGNVGGAEDDFVFEAGVTYHFTMGKYGSGDGTELEITRPMSDWVTVEDVTNPYELTGLNPGTYYEWQVKGFSSECTEGSEWSATGNFTTLPLTLDVDGNKWYAISSPVNTPNVTNVSDLIITSGTELYDFYRYNEASATWENYKASHADFTTFENGRGYIYRRTNDATLSFTGTLNDGNNINVPLSYTEAMDEHLKGFNLVGNPYSIAYTIGRACYSLNTNGTWAAQPANYEAEPFEGVLVQAENNADQIVFSNGSSKSAPKAVEALALKVSGNGFEDVTYAMLENGKGLNKIGHMVTEAPALSIAVDGSNYAIAYLGYEVESFLLTLNAQPGTYTIALNSQISSVNYCRLLDKLTGKETDLLSEAYTFSANGNNSERFTVLLSPRRTEANTEGEIATWNGNGWTINGEGTLQVFDVMGRKLFNQEVKGYSNLNTDQLSTGVYVIRLGEKSQKIVVK